MGGDCAIAVVRLLADKGVAGLGNGDSDGGEPGQEGTCGDNGVGESDSEKPIVLSSPRVALRRSMAKKLCSLSATTYISASALALPIFRGRTTESC